MDENEAFNLPIRYKNGVLLPDQMRNYFFAPDQI